MLRRRRASRLFRQNGSSWPIWEPAGTPPPEWPGWPEGKRFALVLTHDVESDYGVSHCEELADIEEERGFRSAFAFVPLRYKTPVRLRRALVDRGFTIMVHDFNHDGKLYRSRRIFDRRRGPINDFLKRWSTGGFTSGGSLHNLSWIGQLNIDYDISTYDVDPFEPQRCGLGRIFPCWVEHPCGGRGFIELPYTLPQDFTVFILLGEQSNTMWQRKLDWIVQKGGMALIKTHPDYMFFREDDKRMDRYTAKFYVDLLDYVRSRYGDEAWLAQPSDVACYWRELRPLDGGNMTTIAAQEMFCSTCREAHAVGGLRQYAPVRFVGTPEFSPDARCVDPGIRHRSSVVRQDSWRQLPGHWQEVGSALDSSHIT